MLKSRTTIGALLLGACIACTANADVTGPIPLPGADLFPEGIALADSGTAYVGSLARGEIWAVDTETQDAKLFAGKEADLMSVIGVYVNAAQDRLYACSSDPAQKFGGRATELVAFSISDGKVVHRHPFPESGLCNDIAELSDGTILATDSVHPRIMALQSDGSFSEWLRDSRFKVEGFGLNGIAISGDTVVVGVFAAGSLFRIDVSTPTPTATAIDLDRPLKGPDGIEFLPSGDLVVVEGMNASVATVTLSEAQNSGTVNTIANGFDVPTTLAILGDQALVVQGQLGRFFGMDPSPVNPFELAVMPLPE